MAPFPADHSVIEMESSRTYDLKIRCVSDDKLEAIRRLFDENEWNFDFDIEETRPNPSCSSTNELQNYSESLNEPSTSVQSHERVLPPIYIDVGAAAEGECPHCFCSPCVTKHRQSWLGNGQKKCKRNANLRKTIYKRFWSMLDRRGAWKHSRYIQKKNRRLAQDNPINVIPKREIMPDCVVSLVRDLYPNPDGVPYMDHLWW